MYLALAIYLLFDDEDECPDQHSKRRKTHNLISSREREGAFAILIEKYLFSNEDKFVQYFRVTPHMFDRILNHIKDDIVKTPYNRVKNTINPRQKLCLALR